jgi:hypothetical protein
VPPPLAAFDGVRAAVGLEWVENGFGEVGEVGGVEICGEEAGLSVRWHSFKMDGIEEAGKREGSVKAWMEVKMLLA